MFPGNAVTQTYSCFSHQYSTLKYNRAMPIKLRVQFKEEYLEKRDGITFNESV